MNKVFIFLSICLCAICQSCQNDNFEASTDVIKDEINADPEGLLLNGGEILI